MPVQTSFGYQGSSRTPKLQSSRRNDKLAGRSSVDAAACRFAALAQAAGKLAGRSSQEDKEDNESPDFMVRDNSTSHSTRGLHSRAVFKAVTWLLLVFSHFPRICASGSKSFLGLESANLPGFF